MQLTWLIVSTHLKLALEAAQTLSKSPTIEKRRLDCMSFQQVTVLTHHQHSTFFKDEDCVCRSASARNLAQVTAKQCGREQKHTDTTSYR